MVECPQTETNHSRPSPSSTSGKRLLTVTKPVTLCRHGHLMPQGWSSDQMRDGKKTWICFWRDSMTTLKHAAKC